MPNESPLRCHLCYLAGRGDVMPKERFDADYRWQHNSWKCPQCGERENWLQGWNSRQRQLAELLPDLRAELERVTKERDDALKTVEKLRDLLYFGD